MKKIFKSILYSLIICTSVVYFSTLEVKAFGEDEWYNNKYISYSPDGGAFTIGLDDRTAAYYGGAGLTCKIYGQLDIPNLKAGYHTYQGLYKGFVPVGYWKLHLSRGKCIHSFSGFNFNINNLNLIGSKLANCHSYYNPGWIPYCAYCGGRIANVYMYITMDMAYKTTVIPSGNEFSNYFYLCPYDRSLENYNNSNHRCTIASANRYKIHYSTGISNTTGTMNDEWFYYDNATTYEGQEVDSKTNISICTYSKNGYTFLGWSNEPEGDILFCDGDEWSKVQDVFSVASMENGKTIRLYAVWEAADEDYLVNPPSAPSENADFKLETNISKDAYGETSRETFLRGEGGILDIKAYYDAEFIVVEFPSYMAEYSTRFNCNSRVTESPIPFIVPLYGVPEDTSRIVVRVTAYKGDEVITKYPIILLDEEGRSILDELRTSLRG